MSLRWAEHRVEVPGVGSHAGQDRDPRAARLQSLGDERDELEVRRAGDRRERDQPREQFLRGLVSHPRPPSPGTSPAAIASRQCSANAAVSRVGRVVASRVIPRIIGRGVPAIGTVFSRRPSSA